MTLLMPLAMGMLGIQMLLAIFSISVQEFSAGQGNQKGRNHLGIGHGSGLMGGEVAFGAMS